MKSVKKKPSGGLESYGITADDLTRIFALAEEILPVSEPEWDIVYQRWRTDGSDKRVAVKRGPGASNSVSFSVESAPGSNRLDEAFESLWSQRFVAGDPRVPGDVRRAKALRRRIEDKLDAIAALAELEEATEEGDLAFNEETDAGAYCVSHDESDENNRDSNSYYSEDYDEDQFTDSNEYWTPISNRSTSGNIVIANTITYAEISERDEFEEPELGRSSELCFFDSYAAESGYVERAEVKGRGRCSKEAPKRSKEKTKRAGASPVAVTTASSMGVVSSTGAGTRRRSRPPPISEHRHERYVEANSLTRWQQSNEDEEIEKSMSYLSNESRAIERQISSKDVVDQISLESKGLRSLDYHLSTLASKQRIELFNIARNSLTAFPICIQLNNIVRINLSRNFLKTINIECDMPALTELDVSNNDLREFPSADVLRHVPNISILSLHSNKIDSIPGNSMVVLAGPGMITDLNLSFNNIESLPDEIGLLKSLASFRLGGNLISRLPRSITSFKSSMRFDISDNKLVYPPQEVAKLGMKYIRGYFEETENKVKFSQFKLIVVGHEGAGKTSTINCLVDAMQTAPVTPGSGAPESATSNSSPTTGDFVTSQAASEFSPQKRSFHSPSRRDGTGTGPESTIGLDIKKVSFRLRSALRDAPSDSGSPTACKVPASSSFEHLRTVSDCSTSTVEDDVVTLSVWDFAGQEIYHSAHEAFFSNQALYLVVWDMRNHSPRNIDLKVQFWIDLIQVRAPGSSIIVVGTHMDSLSSSKAEEVLHHLSMQLQRNETSRVSRISQDIALIEEKLLSHSSDMDSLELMLKLNNLKSTLNLRPKIRNCVSVCTRLIASKGSVATDSYNISNLVDAIVSVSTISKDVQNPFQLVNVLHPMYYETVREVISELKSADYIMDIDDLHRMIQSRVLKGSTATKQSTEAAVAFLASIGEVIWFRDSSFLTTKFDNPLTPSSTSMDLGADFDESMDESDSVAISATWRDAADIGGYVILNPHWLLSAMKCVLTHKLHRDLNISSEQHSQFETSQFFGNPHNEKNGIASWLFVEQLMKRNTVELPKDYHKRLEYVDVLRRIFIMFNIIIPVEIVSDTPRHVDGLLPTPPPIDIFDDAPNTSLNSPTGTVRSASSGEILRSPRSLLTRSHKSSESMSLADAAAVNAMSLGPLSRTILLKKAKSVGDNMASIEASASQEEFFLIPALLSESKKPSLPKFAVSSAGSVRMERRYYFDIFIPPNIIPRVLARAFEFLDRKPVSGGLGTSNQCWRTAFSQMHGPIQIWLWLEEGASSSAASHSARGAVGVLRICGFGSFFRAQEIIQLLDKYSAAATSVLNDFPGLCTAAQTVMCPMCIMSQIEDGECGEFLYSDVLDEFNGPARSPFGHHASDHPQGDRSNKVFNESRCMLCQQRMCSIPFELLVDTSHLGDEIKDRVGDTYRGRRDASANDDIIANQQMIIKRMERSLHYLMSEVIRLSAVPSQSLEKSFASIALCAVSTLDMQNIKLDTPCPIQIHLNSMASGCYVWIPTNGGHEKSLAVMSCAHFCVDKATHAIRSKTLHADFKLIYLVGDTNNWLYIAEMMALGTAMDKPHALHATEQQSYFCRTCMSENPKQQTNCFNCGQPKPSRAMWDVSAMSLTHAIQPIPRLNPYSVFRVNVLGPAFGPSEPPSTTASESSESLGSNVELKYHKEVISPCTAYLGVPALEQSVRLFGLSGLHSLSIDWGRVVQIVGGLILVSVYSDSGASGGPLFDVQGRLLGVLSVSHANAMVSKAFVEPVGDFLRILEKHEFRGHRHDPRQCRYCLSIGDKSAQFVFE